jgi:hypothetical protein
VKELETQQQTSLNDVIPVLLSTARRFHKTYIVIDALDECSADHHADLIHLLAAIQGSYCRVLVTSRPGSKHKIFDNALSIDIKASQEDASLFIRSCLVTDIMFKTDAQLQEEVVETLQGPNPET